MNTLAWVVAGIAFYWFAVLYLDSKGFLPSFIGTQGPILTVHTKRGRAFLDWLASPKRLWRAWGNFGLGMALVVMVGTFLLLVVQAIAIVRNPPPATPATQPQNVLVIPGVNEFLPLSVAPEILLGLLVGLVVHEGGHGLMCRVEDIEIRSMGIAALALLPVGAFVEPDEESRRNANRGSQSRMFAAGVTNNFAVTVLAFALLFGPVVGSIAVAPGAAVGGSFDGSAAKQAGIGGGDRIVAVGGEQIESNDDLDATLSQIDSRTVTVTTAGGEEKQLQRSLLVTAINPESPFASAITVNTDNTTTVEAVDGNEIYTEDEFREAASDSAVVTLRTDTGETVTGPVGVLATVQSDGAGAADGMPEGESVVITSIEDERILTNSDLSAATDGYEPGDTVTVTAYTADSDREDGGEREEYEVTLGENEDGSAMVGVLPMGGYSGMTFSSFGVKLYPAAEFLSILGGDLGANIFPNNGPIFTFLSGVFGVLLLPFSSISLQAGFNFAGFVSLNAGFYTVASGPLSFLGEWGLFLLANALFWTGWVNLNLGFFNCIPAFPLDGGHILRTSTEAIVSRLPTDQNRRLTTMVTTTIGLTMLASLLLMIFGPQLLSG